MRYRRLPHVVRVERLTEPWTWTTSTGSTVSARPGDSRVTDPETGQQWSVAPEALRVSYRQIGPGLFQACGEVAADRVTGAPRTVETLEGPVTARPGDWVVTAPDGTRWAVEDAWFRARYAPAVDDTASPDVVR